MRVPPIATARRGLLRDYGFVFAVIAVVTLLGWFMPLSYRVFGYIYLLAVIVLSFRVRRWPVLVATAVGGLVWNFMFMPPRLSFSLLHGEDRRLLGGYFVVALLSSQIIAGRMDKLRLAEERSKLLEETDRLRHTLLDNVAHELKTPIAIFRAAADQLGTEDAAKRRLLTLEIGIAAQRLTTVVDNLLDQSRVESGTLKPHFDWCDAHDLVATARRSVGDRLADRALSVEIPPDLPIFQADPVLMEQAIGHLLLNAAVHTPAAVPVHIRAGATKDPDRVFIAVADDGPGIAAELQRRIFDKFSRGATAPAGGLGLGLSIVQGFMRAQGGEVRLESPPEGGARFTLSLPFSAAHPVPIE